MSMIVEKVHGSDMVVRQVLLRTGREAEIVHRAETHSDQEE